MTDDSRIRRPALARTAPRRNLAGLFVPPAAAQHAAASGGASDPWTDVVSRSVELGYRVIDEYVRQGEHAARTLGGTRARSDPFTQPRDAADLGSRMTRSFNDFATLWMSMVELTMSGGLPWSMPAPPQWASWPVSPPPPPWAARPTAPAWPGSPTAVAQPHPSSNGNGAAPQVAPGDVRSAAAPSGAAQHDAARLDVELVTHAGCRARVAVELWPEAAGHRLALDRLHGAGGARAIAAALRAASPTAVPTLHIHVPAGQPPGTYTGDVIDDDTAVLVGRVVLRIDPP